MPILHDRLKVANASEDAWGYRNTIPILYGLLHPTYIFLLFLGKGVSLLYLTVWLLRAPNNLWPLAPVGRPETFCAVALQ